MYLLIITIDEYPVNMLSDETVAGSSLEPRPQPAGSSEQYFVSCRYIVLLTICNVVISYGESLVRLSSNEKYIGQVIYET